MTPTRARLLLGVEATASAGQVEAAFRRRAWSSHPDRGGTATEFADLAEARAVLLGQRRPARGQSDPAPVVVVPDANLVREAVARTVRRWAGRRGPRRVV